MVCFSGLLWREEAESHSIRCSKQSFSTQWPKPASYPQKRRVFPAGLRKIADSDAERFLNAIDKIRSDATATNSTPSRRVRDFLNLTQDGTSSKE
jgi:hypothetical protein